MLEPNLIPRKAERTAIRVLDGEALILVIDRGELHRLNEVGTRVFELCDGANSMGAITQEIVRGFEVEEAMARGDVELFVTQLVEVGALLLPEPD